MAQIDPAPGPRSDSAANEQGSSAPSSRWRWPPWTIAGANRVRAVVAWTWGASLAVGVISGLPSGAFDIARYIGVVAIVGSYPPSISSRGRRTVRHWASVLGALAVLRIAFSSYHGDTSNVRAGFLMGAAVIAGWCIAHRPASHRPVLLGFLGGVAVSAVVAIMQALEVPTLAPAVSHEPPRFPGIAPTTIVLTWQLALAIVIALHVARTARTPTGRTAGALAAVVCLVALAVCGTQGGFLGLLVAGLALLSLKRQRLGRRAIVTACMLAAAAASAITVLVLAGASFGIVDEVHPDSGFENERARVDVAVAAVRAIPADPLVGPGVDQFRSDHGILPHFAPLFYGVLAGSLGLIVATYAVVALAKVLLDRPRGRDPTAILGYALVAVMFAHLLPEPSGPFFGVTRIPLLFVAILAAGGSGLGRAGDEAEPPLRTQPSA